MNKTESNQLMIGSWVLADGAPRSICCITTKKVGFKRGTCGQRDFYRFDQLAGIPLSETLLKECVKYRCIEVPKEEKDLKQIEIVYSETTFVFSILTPLGMHAHSFRFLHELQSVLLVGYGVQTIFDVEKYKRLAATTPCHSERSEESEYV